MAAAVPAGRDARADRPGARTVGAGREKSARDLHLHIVSKDQAAGEQFEDSGIGLDDALHVDSALKVLATPPSGKKKTLVSSPKSAPASAGGTGSDSFSAMTFMSEQTAVTRHHAHQTRAIHIVGSVEGGRTRAGGGSPDVHGAPSPPPHAAHSPGGIFSALKESVSRTVSSSSSSSASGSASKCSESHKASFHIGSDSEDEASGGSGRSSRRSSQKSSATTGGREVREAKGKGRFRRMLNPLRRSHSAGCDQDVPAHALFLKHESEMKKLSSSQKSVDKQSPGPDAGRPGSDSEGDDTDRKSSKSKKKSLARDLKDKMAFLRRRHTDTALASKMTDPKSQRLTPEQVTSWSTDFEHLLFDKVGLSLFREFLQSEFSDENLEFWIACEEYKSLKDGKLTTQAQRIYTDFVAVQAPREINLDSKTRMACRNNMANPSKHTFDQSQKRIQGLMEKDSYPRFLKSDTYQELCSELKLNIHS